METWRKKKGHGRTRPWEKRNAPPPPLMYFTDYTAEQGSMHVFQQVGSNKLVD